jgi:hypothetical protein
MISSSVVSKSTTTISVSVSIEDKDYISDMCRKNNVPVATFFRAAAIREIKRLRAGEPFTVPDVEKIWHTAMEN